MATNQDSFCPHCHRKLTPKHGKNPFGVADPNQDVVYYSGASLRKALQRIDALIDPKAEAAKCDPGHVIVKVRQLLDELDSVKGQRDAIARDRDTAQRQHDMIRVENDGLRRQLREKVRG